MLYHVLTSIREMGYRLRSPYKVVLLSDNELEAEYEEDYANYLDLKDLDSVLGSALSFLTE